MVCIYIYMYVGIGIHTYICMNIYILCGGLVIQLCPTLCDLINYRIPASSVHGISQAKILECVAISSSRGSSWPRDRTHISLHCRQILYHWATRENHIYSYIHMYKIAIHGEHTSYESILDHFLGIRPQETCFSVLSVHLSPWALSW